jgi:hypothetical protein
MLNQSIQFDLNKKVDTIITKEVDKNKQDLEFGSIKNLIDQYLYSTNSVYVMCIKIASRKTYWIMKHLLMCDRLFEKPYYDQIIFTSMSDGLDKTIQTIEGEVKTKIEFVRNSKILPYLQQIMKKKMKFYALI